MKNKVKIYAVLLGVVYALMIVTSLVNEFGGHKDAFMKGYETGRNNEPKMVYAVDVIAKSGKYTMPEKIKSEGKEINYEPERISVEVELDKKEFSHVSRIIYSIIAIVVFLLLIGTILYIPILFYQIIRAIVVKEILDKKVVKRITRMGWILIVYYAYYILGELSSYFSAKSQIILDNYTIAFPELKYTILILAMVALLLGQVLKMSLTMKEEQDLTI